MWDDWERMHNGDAWCESLDAGREKGRANPGLYTAEAQRKHDQEKKCNGEQKRAQPLPISG